MRAMPLTIPGSSQTTYRAAMLSTADLRHGSGAARWRTSRSGLHVAAALALVVIAMLAPPATAYADCTSAIAGGDATMTCDGDADTIVVDQAGGLLRHNRFTAGDAGFNSDFDWDSGTGGDQTLSATDTAPTHTFNTGGGADSLTFGSVVTPASGLVPPFVADLGTNPGDTLTVDSSGDASPRTFLVNDGFVAIDTTAFQLTYNQTPIGGVRVIAGPFDDEINVLGTAATVPVTVEGNGGPDDFRVTPQGALVSTIAGNLSFDGGAGTNTVAINDSSRTTPSVTTITPTTVGAGSADTFFPAGASLSYANVASLAIGFGANDDTVIATPSATTTYRFNGNSQATADRLNVLVVDDVAGAASTGTPAAGTATFSNRQTITFLNFEDVQVGTDAPAAQAAAAAQEAAANDPNNDDDEDESPAVKRSKETEEERQQRQRTNRGHRGDVTTEGNVLAVERSGDGKHLLVTIGITKNETLVVQVACYEERSGSACPDVKTGDYLEADGYQNGVGDENAYFIAENVEVHRGGKKVK